jgi:hypothetical protein
MRDITVPGCEALEGGDALVVVPGELRDPADWLVHGLLGDPPVGSRSCFHDDMTNQRECSIALFWPEAPGSKRFATIAGEDVVDRSGPTG